MQLYSYAYTINAKQEIFHMTTNKLAGLRN